MLILHDGNPLVRIRRPWVNMALIFVTASVYALQLFGLVFWPPYAFFPAQLWSLGPEPGPLYGVLGLFTYAFLHGDLLHVGANLIALRVFGDNIEDALGHWRYLFFYLVTAASAAALEGALADPYAPLIGASGAIAAVMGAYLLLHPRARILILAFNVAPVIAPASVVVGFNIALNIAASWDLLLLPDFPPRDSGVAWWAHVGGFVSGMALLPLLKAGEVALFQPPAPGPSMRWLGRYVPALALPGERPPEAASEPPDSFQQRRPGLVVFIKAAIYVVLIVALIRYL
jgi:membrane associated rhomboid family serine protease